MARWEAQFRGRRVGAIGSWSAFKTTVEGADEDAARLALYGRFEHIHGLELRRVCPNCDQYQHPRWREGGRPHYDCCHDCYARGFAGVQS